MKDYSKEEAEAGKYCKRLKADPTSYSGQEKTIIARVKPKSTYQDGIIAFSIGCGTITHAHSEVTLPTKSLKENVPGLLEYAIQHEYWTSKDISIAYSRSPYNEYWPLVKLTLRPNAKKNKAINKNLRGGTEIVKWEKLDNANLSLVEQAPELGVNSEILKSVILCRTIDGYKFDYHNTEQTFITQIRSPVKTKDKSIYRFKLPCGSLVYSAVPIGKEKAIFQRQSNRQHITADANKEKFKDLFEYALDNEKSKSDNEQVSGMVKLTVKFGEPKRRSSNVDIDIIKWEPYKLTK